LTLIFYALFSSLILFQLTFRKSSIKPINDENINIIDVPERECNLFYNNSIADQRSIYKHSRNLSTALIKYTKSEAQFNNTKTLNLQ